NDPTRIYLSPSVPPGVDSSLGPEIASTVSATEPVFLSRGFTRFLAGTWVGAGAGFQLELRVMDFVPSVVELFDASGCGTVPIVADAVPMGDGFLIALS